METSSSSCSSRPYESSDKVDKCIPGSNCIVPGQCFKHSSKCALDVFKIQLYLIGLESVPMIHYKNNWTQDDGTFTW